MIKTVGGFKVKIIGYDRKRSIVQVEYEDGEITWCSPSYLREKVEKGKRKGELNNHLMLAPEVTYKRRTTPS